MKYILLLGTMSMNIFIIYSTFLNDVLNIDVGNSYFIVMSIIASYTIFFSLTKTLVTKRINKTYFYLLLVISIVMISYIASPFKLVESVKNPVLFFWLWAVPGSICGIESRNFKKSTFTKFFIFIFFSFSICLVFLFIFPFITGSASTFISSGLLNYQNASYIAAFIFGIGLYFLSESNVKFKYLYLILVTLMVPIIFIVQGRGGLILLIVYGIFTVVQLINNKSMKLFEKVSFIVFGFLLIFLAYIFFVNLKENRILSYFKDGQFQIGNTSGRDILYSNSIELIKEKLLTGYGMFNYYPLLGGTPHNIFLEILLISGFVGLIIFLYINIYYIYNFIKLYKKNSIDKLVIYIFAYPIVLLFFSGNFLIMSELWFVIFYVISVTRERKNERKNVYQ
ncbi:O-antigen ligase family protein [Mammaliicoccus sciuri]|uniref:O-antigen ligase family protein n=1 Tax=Mammaliicoccus sciuri TaxID=1296 RepID=UPI0018DBAFFE|nr:O-antigen ligase family protein [Mammaliicoccus sciuri]QPW15765.1 O-antigen ligase family protein [Mammaliicoccus sciuri]